MAGIQRAERPLANEAAAVPAAGEWPRPDAPAPEHWRETAAADQIALGPDEEPSEAGGPAEAPVGRERSERKVKTPRKPMAKRPPAVLKMDLQGREWPQGAVLARYA